MKIFSSWTVRSRCRQNTSNTRTGKGFLKRTTGCWEKKSQELTNGITGQASAQTGKHQQSGESLQDRRKRLPSISYLMCLLHVSCLPLDTNWEWAEPMSPEFPIPKTTESSFYQNPPKFWWELHWIDRWLPAIWWFSQYCERRMCVHLLILFNFFCVLELWW